MSRTNLKSEQTRRTYRRASEVCEHFQIAPSTLWNWVKSREGFPQPIKAGPKVTLFDVDAIEHYLVDSQSPDRR